MPVDIHMCSTYALAGVLAMSKYHFRGRRSPSEHCACLSKAVVLYTSLSEL